MYAPRRVVEFARFGAPLNKLSAARVLIASKEDDMLRWVFTVALLISTAVVWRYGHGGAAVALLVMILCLQMSAYVRHLRPGGWLRTRRTLPGVETS